LKAKTMSEDPGFDLEKAHRFFSKECFNRAWDLIEKNSRTPDEDQTMLQLGLASLWHWTQRPDRKPINLSVGNWQVSRIYALLGRADPARQYGQVSLQLSRDAGDFPFYQGYAFEALARAESIGRDPKKMEEYLQKALELSEKIPDPDDKEQFLADLATIK
jgi:tetratricopeptide (TPR) repeat protein